MQINVRNCNNIASAQLTIEEEKLNIRFAPNGTGKSTISKAIQFSSSDDHQSLAELLPFKLREQNPENLAPGVSGIDHIHSIKIFNIFTMEHEVVIISATWNFIKTSELI